MADLADAPQVTCEITTDPEEIKRLCCGTLKREVQRKRLALVRLPFRRLEIVTFEMFTQCRDDLDFVEEYLPFAVCPYSKHKLDERRMGPIDLPIDTPRGKVVAPVASAGTTEEDLKKWEDDDSESNDETTSMDLAVPPIDEKASSTPTRKPTGI